MILLERSILHGRQFFVLSGGSRLVESCSQYDMLHSTWSIIIIEPISWLDSVATVLYLVFELSKDKLALDENLQNI